MNDDRNVRIFQLSFDLFFLNFSNRFCVQYAFSFQVNLLPKRQ